MSIASGVCTSLVCVFQVVSFIFFSGFGHTFSSSEYHLAIGIVTIRHNNTRTSAQTFNSSLENAWYNISVTQIQAEPSNALKVFSILKDINVYDYDLLLVEWTDQDFATMTIYSTQSTNSTGQSCSGRVSSENPQKLRPWTDGHVNQACRLACLGDPEVEGKVMESERSRLRSHKKTF
ncbi:hypothetical protein PoB_004362200 [Plakobranchus ocellatus]|uniref:Uncharacterized protein n=1 Tax=Plakobranchus ocellatus TaxID=259542 RepID=A0AAV4BDU3_9GAST|nr:hypothetical protein PoB_004362200 [Plakobranchus ocellatus]